MPRIAAEWHRTTGLREAGGSDSRRASERNMTKQERAQKTRDALVRAAAGQFDRNGYSGASLAQIRDAARISMGALTFHFSTKAELADTIEDAARTMTMDVVERVSAQGAPSLALVVELTLELTRLLQEQEVVRAAARLARERPDSPEWSAAWLPVVRRILEESYHNGHLHPSASPEHVTALTACLVDGMDAALRRRWTSRAGSTRVTHDLEQLWRLVLTGLTPNGKSRADPSDR
jgi:AcrR family transcriptional regulator